MDIGYWLIIDIDIVRTLMFSNKQKNNDTQKNHQAWWSMKTNMDALAIHTYSHLIKIYKKKYFAAFQWNFQYDFMLQGVPLALSFVESK